jgi:hypothetical protein
MDSPLATHSSSEIKSPATVEDSNQASRANSVDSNSAPAAASVGKSDIVPAAGTSALEQRIAEDPFDADAWLTLLNDAEKEGEVVRVRDVYERFLKVFPTSVSPPLHCMMIFRIVLDFHNIRKMPQYTIQTKNNFPLCLFILRWCFVRGTMVFWKIVYGGHQCWRWPYETLRMALLRFLVLSLDVALLDLVSINC